MRICYVLVNASSCSVSHFTVSLPSRLVSSVIGLIISAQFGMNFLTKFIAPHSARTPFLVVGLGASWILLMFVFVGLISPLPTTNPKKIELEITKPGFRGFNFNVSFFQTLK